MDWSNQAQDSNRCWCLANTGSIKCLGISGLGKEWLAFQELCSMDSVSQSLSWLILCLVHTSATVCSLLLSPIDLELHFTVQSPLWLNIYTYKKSTPTPTDNHNATLTAVECQKVLPVSALHGHQLVLLFVTTHWHNYIQQINTLRTGLLNCLNAHSRGLTFGHRASCI